jgi:hypothetical protein
MKINNHKKRPITQERLKCLLDYDMDTGIFKWKVYRRNKAVPGSIAGSTYPAKSGVMYAWIGVDWIKYPAHTLAWMYVHGEMADELDHIDGDGLNNKISNLRPCTRSQNCANRRAVSNASGYRGVYRERNKWRAQIRTNGVTTSLGSFDDPVEAHAAYVAKAREIFGEFARVS